MDEEVPIQNHQEVHEIREPWLIRTPWISIVFVMVLFFLFQSVPQLILVLSVSQSYLGEHPYIPHIVVFVSMGVLLLVFVPFLMRIPNNNRRYSDYMRDIQVFGTKFKAIIVGLITISIVFILAYGATYLSAWVSKWYLNDPAIPQVITDPSYLINLNAFMNVFYAWNPGIWEEIAFRGIILVLLLKKYEMKKAVVIDGILFGMFHLINLLSPTIFYFREELSLVDFLATVRNVGFQVVYAACLGIAWAFLFVKSKSIIPCILGHYLIDAFGNLVLIPNIANPWIYFISITLLGIGILPAIIDVLVIKGFYPRQKIS